MAERQTENTWKRYKVTVLYLPDSPETSAMIDYGPNVILWYVGLFLTGLSALYYFKVL